MGLPFTKKVADKTAAVQSGMLFPSASLYHTTELYIGLNKKEETSSSCLLVDHDGLSRVVSIHWNDPKGHGAKSWPSVLNG